MRILELVRSLILNILLLACVISTYGKKPRLLVLHTYPTKTTSGAFILVAQTTFIIASLLVIGNWRMVISFAALEGSSFSTDIPTFSAPTNIGVAVNYHVFYYPNQRPVSIIGISHPVEITGSLLIESLSNYYYSHPENPKTADRSLEDSYPHR